jgi:putative peptidoglycan lipid II flippase
VNRLSTTTTDAREARTGRSALLVGLGILGSRIIGLVRQRVISHYFGLRNDAADAWNAGFRIPNLLQNLFGEGALSASFIPVYAALLARGERREADRVAGAVAAILALVVTIAVAIGIIATPLLIAVIAPGFTGARRDLTVTVVRILFPGMGLLVLSAWCLGVLNSHKRFLLSYAAPIIWSAAMIAALLWFGPGTPLPRLVAILAWGSVIGSALQFAVQLPTVFRVAPDLRLVWDTGSPHVKVVIRNFVPAFLIRGVVQVGGYIDTLIASFLSTGAVAGLASAQTLYTLPVSLFGVSIAAAELPAMSGLLAGDHGVHAAIRTRLDHAMKRMAFFVVPSGVALLALGDVIAAGLFQTGRFGPADAVYVWGILAGASVGLLAQTLGRLYASAYYALRDTRTPLRIALVRLAVSTTMGAVFALRLPAWLGIDPAWGAAGLTVSSGIVGWLEMWLLRRAMNARIGRTAIPGAVLSRLWAAAAVAAAVAWAVKLAIPLAPPLLRAGAVLLPYGGTYLLLTVVLGVPDAAAFVRRVRRR